MALRSSKSNEACAHDAQKAYQKLLAIASLREHSTETMRARLKTAGFAEDAIDEALERACASSVINNRRYADALIRQRLGSGKGMVPVFRELEELGVALEEVDAYQDYVDFAYDHETDRAVAFLDRHPTHSKNLRNGAYQKLVHQGFSSSTAAEAARLWAEKHASREE